MWFYIKASYPSVAICWRIKTRKLSYQSCLASSIWPQQSKEFSCFNFKANVFIRNLRCLTVDSWINLSYVLSYQWVFGVCISWNIIDILPFLIHIWILIHQFIFVCFFVVYQFTLISKNVVVKSWTERFNLPFQEEERVFWNTIILRDNLI